MCWRWEVSLISCLAEWACASFLCWRDGLRDRKYGIFMATIATMESLQMFLWLALDSNARSTNFWLSIILWMDAWLFIPWSMVNFVANWSLRHALFALYFLAQALAILALMAASGLWYTMVGPNHHQVWPCAAAMAWAGECQLCIGVCLAFITMVACAITPLPPIEWYAFIGIGIVTFSPSYITLGPTLEACSVWCWSAGAYGAWFCLRPLVIDSGRGFVRVNRFEDAGRVLDVECDAAETEAEKSQGTSPLESPRTCTGTSNTDLSSECTLSDYNP
eukprot:gnl/TRDRNA2_/TRDRNA2_33612_c0_seq2.p1 gnl/TRDRNA2_/TRDRNA2_33612_c0~~gnl/TRDRNA2_/TRDRNA2_33612_c0_seq2.p1  ORF type:complete len:277 (+),score=20.16 gnl/TRDRNA2_/TRDRNA2_33612_c0_seq2:50-880(+)